MYKFSSSIFLATGLSIALLSGCSSNKKESISETAPLSELQKSALAAGFVAIPTDKKELLKLTDSSDNPLTEAKIELGKKLYFEPRLSKSGLISCNTCHNLATGGVDNVPAAIGHNWTANPHHLNSPTVYNAVFMDRQFWDGRDPNLEIQAQGPMQAAPEMASPKELVVERLLSIPAYVAEFKKVFNATITFENTTQAIAAFERTLTTPSKFDKFLSGDATALNDAEQKGLKTFIDKGCTACHTGVGIGGSMQPFPTVNPYPYANIGDFKGDANGMVKTPTLRNITQTAPYFHNGAVWNLSEAVDIMASTQLGIELTKEENSSIVTFLTALEGEKPQVIYPMLPASTETTPKPDAN